MSNVSPGPDEDAELARRKEQAEVEKAEADADKARAEADKARAEADKAAADAAAAATTAANADADLTNQRITASATNAKTIAEASSAATTARSTAYGKLVPDFGEVKAGSLTVGDGPALWATELSASALRRAATAVAADLKKVGRSKETVLVTTAVELASDDALNLEVRQSLTSLTAAAQELCDQIDTALEPPEPAQDRDDDDQTATFAVDPISAVGALAQVIPGLLSLTGANRSVRTAAVEANDLAAVAAVSGALTPGFTVVHDTFRLIPGGEANPVFAAATALDGQRRELVARKIGLGERLAAEDVALRAATETLTAAQAALRANKDAAKSEALARAVAEASTHVTTAKLALARVTSLSSLVEGALSAIDALTANLHSVPTGAARSHLASAALYECLRPGADPQIDYVLLIRAEAGQTNQTVSDRALWLKDRVSVMVEAFVTYLMVAASDSTVCAAGTRTGVAQANGTLGSRLQITAEEVRDA